MLRHCSRGFSLVELMVASALSLALLATALHFHRLVAGVLQEIEAEHRLATALDRSLGLILAEARRAGFRAGGGPPLHSPPGAVLTLGAAPGEPVASCLLYAYDRNGDGLLGVGRRGRAGKGRTRVNMEQFGVRLYRQHLQIRLGGARHACRGGHWEGLTPPEIRVRRLRFARTTGPAGEPRLQVELEAVDAAGRSARRRGSTWLPNA